MTDFLQQVQSDFEGICAGEFSEEVTVADDVRTVTFRCLFDEFTEQFDPDTQSRVNIAEPRITVAETATDFNFRRAGLLVTIRGKAYKIRPSDWEFDGYGQLLIYLDPVRP